jgi:hypothetical protein
MTEQQPARGMDRFAGVSTTEVGQATAVEQARAVAEVAASVDLALRQPRNPADAVRRMHEACEVKGLAERAFYSFSRGGSPVQGPSVHLLRELARTWRNIAYGIAELARDDRRGESQMIAFAWDVEANVRSSAVFIVPHARDTKTGRKDLVDLRDVYENNANQGARRVREMIAAVLPTWYVDEACQRARATLAHGGGVPLDKRIATLVGLFDERFRVTQQQLVDHIGRSLDKWSPVDVAALEVLGRSLANREIALDEVFAPSTGPAIAEQAARSRRGGRGPAAAPVRQPAVEEQPGDSAHVDTADADAMHGPADEHDPTTDPGFGTDEARP